MTPDDRRELNLQTKELLTGFVKRQRQTVFFVPVNMAGAYLITNNIKVSRKNLLYWIEGSCSANASFKVSILAPNGITPQSYVFIYPQYNLPKEED